MYFKRETKASWFATCHILHENASSITGPSWGVGDCWFVPFTQWSSNTELWYFLWCQTENVVDHSVELSVFFRTSLDTHVTWLWWHGEHILNLNMFVENNEICWYFTDLFTFHVRGTIFVWRTPLIQLSCFPAGNRFFRQVVKTCPYLPPAVVVYT